MSAHVVSLSARKFGAAGIAALSIAGALTVTAARAQAATPAETSAAKSVFSLLNSERAAHHLPALGWSTAMVSSARKHNLTMAKANTLSHQLPGEAVFSDRIAAAGVKWHSAAENIGWTTDQTSRGANGMETDMYNEKAPNDGHRQNILSTSVRYVGIDTYIDAKTGKLWLTEDFADVAGPAPKASVATNRHNPVGKVESITVLAGHKVRLVGWAIDPDARSRPLLIAVHVDGTAKGRFGAGVTRTDIAKIHKSGTKQGFSITLTLPAGKHAVTGYAMNIGAGNANPAIGSKTITA